jgi:hypothetical protein
MTLASAWQTRANWNWNLLSELVSSSVRRTLRMTSGLILFIYIGAHLTNHALGLISLDTAERGMEIAVEVWYSVPGTLLLYGAAATHFVLALWAVYERRTFRLPPLELLRIALGFTLPIILIGHAANTRLAYELFGLSSDYTRVVAPPQYEVNIGVSPVMTRACYSPHKRAALIDFYSSKSRIRVEASDALEAGSRGPPRWTVFSGVTDSAFFGSARRPMFGGLRPTSEPIH